ncbi:hypothetical protein D3C86_1365940 [compost metagenome]
MMEKPTVTRGSSEANGSWNTNWMSRRRDCNSLFFRLTMSRPPNLISPPWLSTRRSSERPVVDLPQPDSPTSDSVSPGYRSKLTFSTACTRRCTRLRMPPRKSKRVTRLRTERIGSRLAAGTSCVLVMPGSATGWTWPSTCSKGKRAGKSVPSMAPSFGTADSSALV